MRYSLCSIAFGFIAKVARDAAPLKMCCGKAAYEIAGGKHLLNKKLDNFDIIAEGKSIFPDLKSLFFMIFNVKRGGNMYFNPTNTINDGYMDISIGIADYGMCKSIKMMD